MTTETAGPENSLNDAQTRLMRMLDAVRLEKAAGADKHHDDASDEPQVGCANCGMDEPWGLSSWCPECGYYPKLGRAITPVEMEAEGESEESLLSPELSRTLLVAMGGCFLLAAVSIAVRLTVPDAAPRGQWALVQLIAGGMIFLIAHVRAYALAVQKVDNLPPSSFFFEPAKIWTQIFKILPDRRGTFYAGLWGFLAAALAFGVIGLDWAGMFSHLQPGRKPGNPMKKIMRAAGAATNTALTMPSEEEGSYEEGSGDSTASGPAGPGTQEKMETSLRRFAEDAGATELAKSAADANGKGGKGRFPGASAGAEKTKEDEIPRAWSGRERDDRGTFVIFGYLTNAEGELRSILLAEIQGRTGRFVSKLSLDENSPEVRKELQEVLSQFGSQRPLLPTPYRAHWVRPDVECVIAFTGRTSDGQLREGYLVSFELPEAKDQVRHARRQP